MRHLIHFWLLICVGSSHGAGIHIEFQALPSLIRDDYSKFQFARGSERSLTTLGSMKTRQIMSLDPSPPVRKDDSLLPEALDFIARFELGQCSLMVAFDADSVNTEVLDILLSLPHYKQVIGISTPSDFSNIMWEPFPCGGYLFLNVDVESLLSFADEADDPWDYQGKFVFVGMTKTDLDALVSTKKGNNTEHIVGLVQEDPDELKVYMNQLYWGEGMTLVNRWRKHGLTSDTKIFPDKTWDLRGAPLTLYAFQFEPHVFYKEDGGEELSKPFGRDIQMAEAFAESLNFTLVIKKSPDGEFWGFPDGNGSWNGMNGKMQRREGHFGLGYPFLTNNDDELEAVDFSRFYDGDMSCFMARVEPPLPLWMSLISPFQTPTWLVILLGLVVFSPIIYFISRPALNLVEENGEFQQLSNSFFFTVGVHLRQSQVQRPKREATRIWATFLSLYAIILTTVYGSNLTAFLTVERPQYSIETLQELHTSRLDVIGIGFYFKVSFEKSKNVYIKDFVNRYLRWTDAIDFISLLSIGEAVFVETKTYLDYIIVHNYTDFGVSSMRIMKECYQPQNIAVTLPRHFPVKESFNKIIGWIYDNGLLAKWYMDILHQSKKKPSEAPAYALEVEERHTGIPLSIDHMQGVFYLYFLGLFVSSILLLIEVLHLKDNKERKTIA